MAHPTIALINGLRNAAANLRKGAYYAWGHHGACNCGHLLQATTSLTKEQILTYAHSGHGEWTELAEESCPVTNAPVNLLLIKLEQLGLTPTDIHHIEYLDDRSVLSHLPGGFRWLKKNVCEDVILYFETMADLLEDQLAKNNLLQHIETIWQTLDESGLQEDTKEIALLEKRLADFKKNPDQTEDWQIFKDRVVKKQKRN